MKKFLFVFALLTFGAQNLQAVNVTVKNSVDNPIEIKFGDGDNKSETKKIEAGKTKTVVLSFPPKKATLDIAFPDYTKATYDNLDINKTGNFIIEVEQVPGSTEDEFYFRMKLK